MDAVTATGRSFAARRGLPVLTWALPFHVGAMALLFGVVRLMDDQVRVIAAWKETAVVLLLLSVIARTAAGRGPRTSMAWTDVWVSGLSALCLTFLIGGATVLRLDNPVDATLLGFRDMSFFLLLYWVGRSTPDIASNPRTLRRFFAVALVTAVIGIGEWVLISPDKLLLLGVGSYFQDFLGLSAFTTGNEYGLPHSYWTRIGGREVQRAGSVFLSGQGMAVPFLLLLPAATGALLVGKRRASVWMKIGYALICTGFLLAITRMTIIANLAALLAFLLLLKRPMWAVGWSTVGVGLFMLGLVAIPGLAGFVWETITWQTGSSETHLYDWARGYEAFFDKPFGAGLGTTDLAAVRAGLEPLTIDNQYLKYAVELGFIGLALHLLIFAGIVLAAGRVIREVQVHEHRVFAIVVLTTTIGILVNAVTAAVFNSITLSYLYFWLAGTVVTLAQQLPRAQRRSLALVPAASD